MKNILFIFIALSLVSYQINDNNYFADPDNYLNDIKTELKKEWPKKE